MLLLLRLLLDLLFFLHDFNAFDWSSSALWFDVAKTPSSTSLTTLDLSVLTVSQDGCCDSSPSDERILFGDTVNNFVCSSFTTTTARADAAAVVVSSLYWSLSNDLLCWDGNCSIFESSHSRKSYAIFEAIFLKPILVPVRRNTKYCVVSEFLDIFLINLLFKKILKWCNQQQWCTTYLKFVWTGHHSKINAAICKPRFPTGLENHYLGHHEHIAAQIYEQNIHQYGHLAAQCHKNFVPFTLLVITIVLVQNRTNFSHYFVG